MSEQIQNYYENLVLSYIDELIDKYKMSMDKDFLADVACVALNQLPSKYVRSAVDTTFYMTQQELSEVTNNVRSAVTMAMDYVANRRNLYPTGENKAS